MYHVSILKFFRELPSPSAEVPSTNFQVFWKLPPLGLYLYEYQNRFGPEKTHLLFSSWWLVEPTHLKNIILKLEKNSPGVNITKYLSCHHLVLKWTILENIWGASTVATWHTAWYISANTKKYRFLLSRLPPPTWNNHTFEASRGSLNPVTYMQLIFQQCNPTQAPVIGT